MTVEDARREVVEALREEGCISGTRPYATTCPTRIAPAQRIEPLISLQWFCDMEQLAGPAIEAVQRRHACASTPSGPRPGLPGLAGEHPALVRVAPAVVGPPDPGLVPRR